MNMEPIDTAVYTYISALAPGWTVFHTLDGVQRPSSPCISLRQSTVHTDGDSTREPVDQATGMQISIGGGTVTYEVVAYGDNAMGVLTGVTQMNNINTEVRYALHRSGMSMLSAGDVIDVSGLNDSEWEKRASTNLQFTFAYEQAPDFVGVIEEVELTGELYGGIQVIILPIFVN